MSQEKHTAGPVAGTDRTGPEGPAQAHPPAAPGDRKEPRADTPEAAPRHREAAAFRDKQPAGPDEAPVQVRQAGKEAPRTFQEKWDEVDESSDESFPASDPPARY